MYYLFINLLVCLHCKSVCLHWKIRRFTAFLDSKIHTWLAIVTAKEHALAFPPRNLPKKFRPDPSTFYLVIVVTDKQTAGQTNRQTYAGDYIIPAKRGFRGDHKVDPSIILVDLSTFQPADAKSSLGRVRSVLSDSF